MDAIFLKIAIELRKGDIKKSFELRKELPKQLDKMTEMELVEIVRQNMLGYAKKGQIDNILLAKKLFDMSDDVVNDIMKHAVLSIFSEGDLKTIKCLKKDMLIPKGVSDEIVAYCSSWKKSDRILAIQDVLA